jgi:hypothetical protein
MPVYRGDTSIPEEDILVVLLAWDDILKLRKVRMLVRREWLQGNNGCLKGLLL